MGEKVIFDLKLPEGSTCIGIGTVEKIGICAGFDVPKRGLELYILNPDTGKIVKIEDL